ncbi:MAG: hypothetical protein ACFB4J_00440 [Elainellaceae cyanobacterium]
MNQPTTHRQTQPAASSGSSYRDIVLELQSTKQQLRSVNQQNRHLIQQNQQLRVEIERIMASALNLHHIIYASQPATAQPAPSSDPSIAPEAPGTSGEAGNARDASANDSSVNDVSINDASANDGSAEDMFAELDQLLAEPPEPLKPPQDDDESLKAALSHVNVRRRVGAEPAESAQAFAPRPAANLRPAVVMPNPAPASSAPRKFNLWMVLVIIAVMLSCFGAGFLLTLPLLQQSSD